MDIIECVRRRHSIRSYKPDPVPEKTVREIMELALRTPSHGNTQPWEFAIATGAKLDEIKQAYAARIRQEAFPDMPYPPPLPEPLAERRKRAQANRMEVLEIKREDKERRQWWLLQGLTLFQAPCAVYIYFDRSAYKIGDVLNPWPIYDCGLVSQTIMLLATGYGIGTTPMHQAVNYPDILRKALSIPESKFIVVGIAMGYPKDEPINRLVSEREPLEKVSTWFGF